ncbi:hypothetical protein ACIRLA_46390 [Streptomyces sp. NPDC102364]|uniref:hypothetical protein n=1 Tax=Streptomyces sp. NPDC102364 TaxID=3366161 RepID=UPI003808888E
MKLQQNPPGLDHPDAVRRLAAILKHAERLRQTHTIAVDEITVSYGGAEWRIDVDDALDGEGEIEWWTHLETGTRVRGAELTRGEVS